MLNRISSALVRYIAPVKTSVTSESSMREEKRQHTPKRKNQSPVAPQDFKPGLRVIEGGLSAQKQPTEPNEAAIETQHRSVTHTFMKILDGLRKPHQMARSKWRTKKLQAKAKRTKKGTMIDEKI